MQKFPALLLLIAPVALHAAEPVACRVPGHAIQWIADYCLFREQTDDLVAVAPCMERERSGITGDECAVRLRYKAKLCKLHLSTGARRGTLAACISDPHFAGTIVRNDGEGSP
jgi:hypothetical protein